MTKRYISVEKLTINACIGIYEHEHKILQPLLLDLLLEYDFSTASRTDAIEDTVDYAELTQTLCQRIGEKKYGLIEHVAADIVHWLETDYGLHQFFVKVSKPTALPNSQNVAVIIDTLGKTRP